MAQLKFLTSINEISAEQWNALWPNDYPFTRHQFLKALEESKATNAETGWQAKHACLFEKERLIAQIPMFEKTHSYGEYVFDWSWADAYHRNHLNYYPKWLAAVPFTPATGPRIAAINEDAQLQLCKQLKQAAEESNISGLHILFPEKNNKEILQQLFSCRLGTQFHWFNQQYQSFEHYLSHFSSRKRKNILKERSKVASLDVEVKMQNAENITEEQWQRFYELYQITYLKRSGHHGYLNLDFFLSIARDLPKQTLLCGAYEGGQLIAAALYFRDENNLYGRYWGALAEFDSLHFECCYYQGIEYAIKNKLARFDPGAQGEHKIQRGFTPVYTCSYHHINHPGFRDAINNFLQEEQQQIKSYTQSCREHLPFKEGSLIVSPDTLLLSEEG